LAEEPQLSYDGQYASNIIKSLGTKIGGFTVGLCSAGIGAELIGRVIRESPPSWGVTLGNIGFLGALAVGGGVMFRRAKNMPHYELDDAEITPENHANDERENML